MHFCRVFGHIDRGIRFELPTTIYTSFYSNITTSIVGIILGCVFEEHQKNVKIESQALFYGFFLGLPSIAIYFTYHTYSRLVSAVLTIVLRPLFATGIAIGIYGMSQDLGGVLRRFLEWRVIVLLGSVTYSTYLVNFVIFGARANLSGMQLLVMSDFVFVSE